MEADARYTWVGAGVLVLAAALVAGLMWLGSAGRAADQRAFLIYFEQQALDGLDIGADVLLRGIKVGRVADYALSADKINRVRVTIRVDRRAPVHANTVAVITRNFVTGIASITLVTREPVGPPLDKVPDGETHPVIAEGRSDLDAIAGRVNQVGEMASTALSNVNQLLDEDNRKAVGETLRNLQALTAGLNQRLTALDGTLARVGTAADRFGQAAGRLGGAGDRIAAVAETGGGRIGQSLDEADRTLTTARQTLQQLNQGVVSLQDQVSRVAGRLDDTLDRADDQLGAAVVELRLSVEAATRTIDALRQPRAALLGPGPSQLGPGEALQE